MPWAAQWHSCNALGGEVRHLIRETPGDLTPILFRTRREAREWIREQYGYIAKRADLRAEPHGWRTPKAVRVSIVVSEGKEAGGGNVARVA